METRQHHQTHRDVQEERENINMDGNGYERRKNHEQTNVKSENEVNMSSALIYIRSAHIFCI